MQSVNQLVLESLEDLKAQDIQILDVAQLTTVTDYMVIATGTSTRHTQSLAKNLIQKAKAVTQLPLTVEGEKAGEWILIDLGNIIVHIMLSSVRKFYSLEKLWQFIPQKVSANS